MNEPLEYPCSKCGAAPGEDCRTPTKPEGRHEHGYWHAARYAAWRAVCPAGGEHTWTTDDGPRPRWAHGPASAHCDECGAPRPPLDDVDDPRIALREFDL